MRISKQGLDFIKSFEGLRLQSYWDKDGKVWTVGWGHTKNVYPGDVITREQADIAALLLGAMMAGSALLVVMLFMM